MESSFIKSVDIKEMKATDAEYHASDFISASALKKIKVSPAHYKLAEKEPPTDAMRFGSAYHCFVLEPERFETDFYVFDDRTIYEVLIGEGFKSPRSTKDYKAWLESENQKIQGREMVSFDEFTRIQAMRDRLFSHPYSRMLLTGGLAETGYAGVVETEAGPVNVKFKPDMIQMKKRIIVDLKTAADASVDGFTRSAADHDYHIQAAFYSDLMTKMFEGHKDFGFYFIAQEKKSPYAFNIFEAGPQFIAQGRYEYEMLVQLFKHCIDTDTWPGYQVFCNNRYGINELKLPAWAVKSLDYYIYK
jgi:exodeoxyribonuclease VIII